MVIADLDVVVCLQVVSEGAAGSIITESMVKELLAVSSFIFLIESASEVQFFEAMRESAFISIRAAPMDSSIFAEFCFVLFD